MSDERKITFRRIRGRIVPIKVKKQHKDLAAGGALVAAGATVGIQAGKLAANMVLTSAHLENKSRQLNFKYGVLAEEGPKYRKAAIEMGEATLRTRLKSFRLFSSRLKVLKYGKIGAAALVGAGLNKLYEGATKKDAGSAGDILGHVAGTAAGFALLTPYYARLSGRVSAPFNALKSLQGAFNKFAPKKRFF